MLMKKRMKSVTQQLILVVFFGIVIFAFFINLCSNSSASKNPNNLQLISSKIDNNPYMTEITGQIKNNTNKEFSFTEVEFNIYDASGNKVGSTEDNSGDLKPGAIWNFDAIGTITDAKTYKVVKLTGN